MIARQHRFHGHGTIQALYRTGDSVRGQFFTIKYRNNNRSSTYRAAIVVSRKVHKSAVVRNRIRRRMYEHIRTLHVIGPWDFVVTCYSDELARVASTDLRDGLCQLLDRAHIPYRDHD